MEENKDMLEELEKRIIYQAGRCHSGVELEKITAAAISIIECKRNRRCRED